MKLTFKVQPVRKIVEIAVFLRNQSQHLTKIVWVKTPETGNSARPVRGF